jgi:hypothetical protein
VGKPETDEDEGKGEQRVLDLDELKNFFHAHATTS